MANLDIHLLYHSNNLSTKYHIRFSLSTYAGVSSTSGKVKSSIHVAPITHQFTLWNMKTCTVIVYTTHKHNTKQHNTAHHFWILCFPVSSHMCTMPLPTLHATTDICSYIFTSALTKFTLNQASNQQLWVKSTYAYHVINKPHIRAKMGANLCARLNYYKRILKNRQHWQN